MAEQIERFWTRAARGWAKIRSRQIELLGLRERTRSMRSTGGVRFFCASWKGDANLMSGRIGVLSLCLRESRRTVLVMRTKQEPRCGSVVRTGLLGRCCCVSGRTDQFALAFGLFRKATALKVLLCHY